MYHTNIHTYIYIQVAKALAPSVILFEDAEWTFLGDKKKIKSQWQGEKPPSRFMKDLVKEAKFLKEQERVLIAGTSSRVRVYMYVCLCVCMLVGLCVVGEKPPSRFMKDLVKEAKFLKEQERVLIAGTSSRVRVCMYVFICIWA